MGNCLHKIVERPWAGSINWKALNGVGDHLFRRAGDHAYVALKPLASVSSSGHGRSFEQLEVFLRDHQQWTFGHFSYELKNELEPLSSSGSDRIGFPTMHFFIPGILFEFRPDNVIVHATPELGIEAQELLDELLKPVVGQAKSVELVQATSQGSYREQVGGIMDHIQAGDVYELNYCIEHVGKDLAFEPYAAFQMVDDKLNAPFAAFYRLGDRYALCASPERFLRMEGTALITDPMKGTRPRSPNKEKDAALAEELRNDTKERAENVMAVDVSRNDLSRVAASGSVSVEDLCIVKTFAGVHQMTSTVKAELRKGVHPVEAIKAAFPMASMTGAPKIRAMQIIEQHEPMLRGLFSGSLGYFKPSGEFDLNVVIRTLQFNATSGALSLFAGGAITSLSNVEQEYAEAMHKAKTVLSSLQK